MKNYIGKEVEIIASDEQLKRLGIPTNEKNKKWVVVDFDFICPINGQMVKINDTFDKKYHFYYLIPFKFLKTI